MTLRSCCPHCRHTEPIAAGTNTQAALTARAESGDEVGLTRLKDDLRAALASAGVELVESTSAAH